MPLNLPKAEFQITAENRSSRTVRKARDSLQDLGRTAGNVAGTIGRITGVATAAAGGLAYMTDRTLDSVQQLERLADTTGFSAERIQELRFAFRATGGDVERLDDNLGEMSQRMGEAVAEAKRTGGEVGEMGEGFLEAGLSIQQLQNMAPEQVFQRVIRAMAQAETQTEALSIAAKTFGDEGGRAMVAFAREGTTEIERLTERAREMGVVMDEDVVAGASDAADQLDTLKQIVTTQFTAAIAQLGPDIAEFTGELAENPEVIKDFATDVADLAGNIATLAEKAAAATGELSDLVDVASGKPGLDQQIEDQRMLVKEARHNLESIQDPGVLRSMSQGLGLDMSEDEARKQLEQRARRLTALLTMQRQQSEGLPGPFGSRAQGEPDIPGSPDAGGGSLDGRGRGTTPQPGMTGVDLQAARKRADEFDRIWSDTLRRQHAMHESVAEENAEAYRTLDQEWNKAVRQQQALEEQSKATADVMADAFDGWANRFSSTLTDTIFDAEKDLKDFANTMVETFARMGTQAFIQQGIKGFVSSMGSGSGGNLEGFADGGSFTVGSGFPSINAGRDNRLVAFAARDGERVSVTPSGGGGGSPQINQTITVQGGGDVDMAAVREAARQGAEGGYRKALDDARRGGPLRKAMQS